MPNNKSRILIVEDDAVFRRGLARMFSRDCFEVLQLEDGRAAVDSIFNRTPDLVVCDYRLPGLDGLGVLDRLRQTGRETPFILMTAYHTDDLVAKAMERGATAVLEKPVNLDRLRRQCRRALGG